jgi:RNA polymerase sigma factor (sigma-70 family)
MVVEAKSYLTAPIEWSLGEDPEYPYEARYQGHKLLVRLNDFPDEELYALIADGEEITNFDDWPHSWNRPGMAETTLNPYVNDPTFQAQLNQACKLAFEEFSNAPYDNWEELKNEILIKLYVSNKFAEYRKLTDPTAYFYRIAVNQLISQRRNSFQPPDGRISDIENLDLQAEDRTTRVVDEILTEESLTFLKDNERFVVESWMRGKNIAEIASELKVSRQTISTSLVKIIKKIRRHVEQSRH